METGGRIPAASLVERLGRPDYKFNYTDLTHMWPGGFHQKVLDWMLYGSRLPVQSRQAVMESCEFYIYDEGARYPEPASPSMPPKWADHCPLIVRFMLTPLGPGYLKACFVVSKDQLVIAATMTSYAEREY